MSHLLQKYKDAGASLFKDQNSFYALLEVFKAMLTDRELSPVYLVVDVLDKCSEDRKEFISLILTTLTLSCKVKWLLSSCLEVDLLAKIKTSKTLVELDTERLRDPVKAYIKHKLNILKGKKGYNKAILDEISGIVHYRAGNTFLWVALAFKVLEQKHGQYAFRLISKMLSRLSDLY